MSDMYTLITGASSGMGEATAKLLSLSSNIIISGRDENRLNKVAEECKKNGHDVKQFPFDLVNADKVALALVDFISEHDLCIDVFVHCAGMTEVLPMAKTKYSVGLEVMNVNYFAATEIISTLLKKRTNKRALRNIVLVTSIIANGGKRYQPHYCASKGALTSLTYALAYELAPDVRVNAIAPGSFKTRIINTLYSDQEQNSIWAPPSLLSPLGVEEIAKTVRYLVSDESKYVTGQIINVDGGERFPQY